jgi:sec-independent protein translocase protein TatB
MFDIGFSKILVIFGLALVVLGPEKLPRVAATVGRWVGRARVMARQFRDQLEQESEGLRKHSDGLREAADSFRQAADGLRREFDPNAAPVPGQRPTAAPSPVPMTGAPASSAEPLAAPDPAARPPLHSDVDELVRDPAAPTPETPPPPKHEPGT